MDLTLRFAVLFAVLICSVSAAGHLTISPDIIKEGLTSELTVRCSVNDAASTVSTVLLMQLEKVEADGSQMSIATMHNGNDAELDSLALADRATVTGVMDNANMSLSHLQVVIGAPSAADDGQYVCVIMALDNTNLLTQIRDEQLVNSSADISPGDIQAALNTLMREVATLRVRDSSGACTCAGQSQNQPTDLSTELQELRDQNQNQASQIAELQDKVAELDSRMQGGSAGSTGPGGFPVTPMKPTGFVAVGEAGSVQYTSTVYNTNGSFNLQMDRFTAPAAGFYFFHAYDSQPSSPLLSLVLNDHPLANSAKAVLMRPANESEIPRYSPLTVSGLVHLNVGDVVAAKYVSNTQSMGASFSGALVSANDA